MAAILRRLIADKLLDPGEIVMGYKLRRICKTTGSTTQGQCPAMYAVEGRYDLMVGQGKDLDADTAAELVERADDESGVLIPTETVLRAAALFLADRGRADIMMNIDGFLAEWEGGSAE